MLKLKCTAALLLVAVFSLPNKADAAFMPSTATVDVQIRDVLLLSSIPGGEAGAAALAAAWNAQSPNSISSDGVTLLAGLAGPSVWGSPGGNTATGLASYTVNAQANRNAGAAGADFDQASYRNQQLSTVANPASSIFVSSGQLIADAAVPDPISGDFFAHGRAEINNPFKASVLSDTSAPIGLNEAFATANDLNGTININLDTAAQIAAVNGGSSVFDIRVYIDTILASIDLSTDGPGSFARGEYSLTVSMTGFSAANGGGTQTNLGSVNFGDTRIAGEGTDIVSDLTAFGPSTSGGLLAMPFFSATVDAATIRSINLNIQLTSTAEVVAPVPEPSSLILFGIGVACVTVGGMRRRKARLASR